MYSSLGFIRVETFEEVKIHSLPFRNIGRYNNIVAIALATITKKIPQK